MITAARAGQLMRYLTPEEREELDALLAQDMEEHPWRPLPGPQQMAYESDADIVGYGGAAGGGKTDLIAGLVLTKHKRALVARREKAQTEGFVQRMSELLGDTSGLNSQKGIWWLPGDSRSLVELAGLDNPGDERRWQGRPHDLKAFDEVTEQRESQVRFVMGWTRTNDPNVRPKVLMTFNPPNDVEGRWVINFFGPWLDKRHKLFPTPPGKIRWCAMLPNKDGKFEDQWVDTGAPFVLVDGAPCYEFREDDYTPEQIIHPKSRTFIPAKLTDNPYYMATNYMSTLQSLPEPLRSRLLLGDFQAGIEDSEWQVIPTLWVEKAQARWAHRSPKGEQLTMGVDVARGGKDRTTIATRYRPIDGSTDWWFDELRSWPGTETPNGPTVAGYTIAARRDDSPIHVDVIGVGAAVFDVLNQMSLPAYGINVAEKATSTDKSGRLTFHNLRSQLVWRMRELLDPEADNGIALPPDPELLRELCAFHWEVSGFRVKVSSREELFEELGVSVDKAWAVILATIETPKISRIKEAQYRGVVVDYDPLSRDEATGVFRPHDPFA